MKKKDMKKKGMKGITGIAVGVLIALLLIVPAGGVMAADQSSDTDMNTTIRCNVEQGLPVINYVKFMDDSWTLRNNTQIDVLDTYYFEIEATQDTEWSDIDHLDVLLWFDFGDDSAVPTSTTTNNTQFLLRYDNSSGTESFGLVDNGNGEVTFDAGSITYVNSTTSILNFSFTPQNEIRHATGAANGGPGFNDLNSWNYRVNATNTAGYTSANWDDEFGVYRYTTVSAVNDPEGTGTPGQNNIALDDNGNTVVTYSANEKFKLSVGINDLTDGSNTITADNVRVMGGDIGSYTAFASGGSTQWIYGGSASYHSAYDTYNPSSDHTVTTSWVMDIPFGTPSGTYTSTVTYTITVA